MQGGGGAVSIRMASPRRDSWVDVLVPDIRDFIRELKDVEWDKLGMHLGFRDNEIREIERDNPTIFRMKMAMLDMWKKREETATWEKIISALEQMKENSLASRLRKKYCGGSEENPELQIDRNDKVSTELEGLQESYIRLVNRAEAELENVNPPSRQLKRFSAYLSSPSCTVEELFDCIGGYSFLDYTLLDRTVSFFLKEAQTLVHDLKEYIQQLKIFKKSTTIKDFMDNIEKTQISHGAIRGTGVCTVSLRLVGGWLEKTMQDLEKLLEEVFQDKKSVLAHLKVSRGSVFITFRAPKSEIETLIEKAHPKCLFMPQVGVCELRIGLIPIIVKDEDADFSFESSLVTAVKNNDIDLLTFLLDINTNPDATNEEGQTALMVGKAFGRDEAVSLLLNAKFSAIASYQRRDAVTKCVNTKPAQKRVPVRTISEETIKTSTSRRRLMKKRTISEGAVTSEDNIVRHDMAALDTGNIQQNFEATKPQSVSIVMLGKSGSGKSSLASALAGIKKSTKGERIQVGKGNVNVINSDEMMDKSTRTHESMVTELLACKNGVIIVCIEMNTRVDESFLEELALLHKKFGQDFWSCTIIALTKADCYEEHKWLMSKSESKTDKCFLKEKFTEGLERRRSVLKKKFTAVVDQALPHRHIGMSEEVFDKIPIIPTAQLNQYSQERMNQVGNGHWFDLLLIKCCQKLRAQGFELQANRDRLSHLPPGLLKQELSREEYTLYFRNRMSSMLAEPHTWHKT